MTQLAHYIPASVAASVHTSMGQLPPVGVNASAGYGGARGGRVPAYAGWHHPTDRVAAYAAAAAAASREGRVPAYASGHFPSGRVASYAGAHHPGHPTGRQAGYAGVHFPAGREPAYAGGPPIGRVAAYAGAPFPGQQLPPGAPFPGQQLPPGAPFPGQQLPPGKPGRQRQAGRQPINPCKQCIYKASLMGYGLAEAKKICAAYCGTSTHPVTRVRHKRAKKTRATFVARGFAHGVDCVTQPTQLYGMSLPCTTPTGRRGHAGSYAHGHSHSHSHSHSSSDEPCCDSCSDGGPCEGCDGAGGCGKANCGCA